MRDMSQGDKLPRNLPIRAAEIPLAKLRQIGKAIHASVQEIELNPRARSAVLRVAEYTGGLCA
jgi:16S rRNA (cytosine1402-N4)-methyltransferase